MSRPKGSRSRFRWTTFLDIQGVFLAAGVTPTDAEVNAVLEMPYASRMDWGLRLNGLCVFCRSKNDTDQRLCSGCAATHRDRTNAIHQRRKKRKACPYCGGRLGRFKWACDRCADRKNELRKIRRANGVKA